MASLEEDNYAGFYGVNIDSNGEYTYDQAAVGHKDEEYIIMTRDLDQLFREERSKANVELGKFEKEMLEPPQVE